MAGWSAAYDAVFAKYGFIVSNDLDEAVTIAALLTTNPMPRGDRVAVLTVSGGAGIWGADTVSMQGLQVPELSKPIQAEIRALLPSYGATGNPIDVTAQGVHSGGLQKSIDLLDVSDEVDAILVVLSLSSETRMPFKQAELKPVIDAQNKPIMFYSYTLPSDFARKELAASGAVVLSGLTHAGVAMRQMVQRARFKLAPPDDPAASPLRDISAHLKSATLSEFDSKSLLRHAGIALPDEVLVTEKAALDTAIARAGFPLVMKIQSRDIPHKSEVGGVRVNITTKGEAFAAYQALKESAGRHRPDAALQGVLVGPMAKKGVEIIVGTLLDATFGPMIMVGLGGITTELFRDVVYRPAPVSAVEASAMLAGLKAAPLLRGFRGAAKADVAALSQLISQVSRLAAAARDKISEIELNPVLVHPEGQGVTIVDALVVPRKT
jgi:acetyltransferase